MQHYNFADEIVKDRDNTKVQRRYTHINVFGGDNIFTGNENNFNDIIENDASNNRKTNTLNKALAFKEGLKNDGINL